MEFQVIKVGASWCGKCRQVEWEGEEWDFDNLTEEQCKLLDRCKDVKELPLFIMIYKSIDREDNSNVDYLVNYIGGLDTRKDVDEWIVRSRMEYLAKLYGYTKSEHFDKIVNARIRMGLNWNQCPCGGDGRGCISELCHKEINEQGHCHCNCYLK